MFDLDKLAALPLFNNSLLNWSVATAVALGALLALLLIRQWIRNYYRRLQATPQTELLEIPVGVLSRTTTPFFMALRCIRGCRR